MYLREMEDYIVAREDHCKSHECMLLVAASVPVYCL